MKKEHKERIAYNKPELVDLDGGEGIAGGRDQCASGSNVGEAGIDCMTGSMVSGYCGSGAAAASSGCNSGSSASCSAGSYV